MARRSPQVGHPDRHLVGGVQPVLDGDVVEQVVEGPSLRLGLRGELAEQQQRGDAVLVLHALGVDAVAERLLVAEGQARRRGRST